MTEQVIDIRDRIEKMRNEITVPNKESAVKVKKQQFNEKNIEEIDLSKKPLSDKNSRPKNVEELDISQKPNLDSKNEEKKSNSAQEIPKNEEIRAKVQSFKKYEDYQNDRIFDEKQQSVKLDEKQPFPQFSLNVSNPISWKLMLLIMLMQLLTNMMLVVVLYLK